MDLRITTDQTAEVLTVDEITQFIKFEDSEEGPELQLIEEMISSVRSHFEKRTGLSFAQKTYIALFRPSDTPFMLPVMPVISVDKVELVDYLAEATELTLNTDYYKLGMTEIEIVYSGFTNNTDRLRVTFKAGYGNAATETLPRDIKEAMKMQVMRWYDNRDDFHEMNILGSIERILQHHKTRLI